MFYPVFTVFMILVVIYVAAAVIEYGMALSVRGNAGVMLFVGALVLLAISLWWLSDAVRRTPPTSGIQLLRAVVFLLLSGPVLTVPPLVAQTVNGGSALLSIGHIRRAIWRPASIIGLIMIVLWFLS